MNRETHRLLLSLDMLLKHSREGSPETQKTRRKTLRLTFTELNNSNLIRGDFGLTDIHGLQHKHIVQLVDFWLQNELSLRTIKNRLPMCWLCKKINKSGIIPPNSILGLSDHSPKAELFTRKSRTVYVGHLPPFPHEDDIIIKFSEFGDIEHIKIGSVDYHGINQSFALITYNSAYGAQSALAMNKQQFLSHKMRVRMTK